MVIRTVGIVTFIFRFCAGSRLVRQRVVVHFVIRVSKSAFVAIVTVFDACSWNGLDSPARDGPVCKFPLQVEQRSTELPHRMRIPASLCPLTRDFTVHK